MAEKKGDQQEEGEGRMGKRREVAQRGAEYPFGSVLVRDGDNENNQGEAMQASLM